MSGTVLLSCRSPGAVTLQRRPAQPFVYHSFGNLLRRKSARSCLRTAAKKTARQQQQAPAEEEPVNPKDLFTGYKPIDDEGNPWWEPPERDFWEGAAWDFLGKGAAIVLPLLLTIGIATGIFAVANYVRGPVPDVPPQQQAVPAPEPQSDQSLDLMLGGSGGGGGDGGSSSKPGAF